MSKLTTVIFAALVAVAVATCRDDGDCLNYHESSCHSGVYECRGGFIMPGLFPTVYSQCVCVHPGKRQVNPCDIDADCAGFSPCPHSFNAVCLHDQQHAHSTCICSATG